MGIVHKQSASAEQMPPPPQPRTRGNGGGSGGESTSASQARRLLSRGKGRSGQGEREGLGLSAASIGSVEGELRGGELERVRGRVADLGAAIETSQVCKCVWLVYARSLPLGYSNDLTREHRPPFSPCSLPRLLFTYWYHKCVWMVGLVLSSSMLQQLEVIEPRYGTELGIYGSILITQKANGEKLQHAAGRPIARYYSSYYFGGRFRLVCSTFYLFHESSIAPFYLYPIILPLLTPRPTNRFLFFSEYLFKDSMTTKAREIHVC